MRIDTMAIGEVNMGWLKKQKAEPGETNVRSKRKKGRHKVDWGEIPMQAGARRKVRRRQGPLSLKMRKRN